MCRKWPTGSGWTRGSGGALATTGATRGGGMPEVPTVAEAERIRCKDLGSGFFQVIARYGFMETPNVPACLAECRQLGLKFDIMATSFFLGHRVVRPAAHSGMPLWQDKLFISLYKSAANATDYFHIPTGRVVELGTQMTV